MPGHPAGSELVLGQGPAGHHGVHSPVEEGAATGRLDHR